MTDSDTALRTALRGAQARKETGRVPDFDGVWAGASKRAKAPGSRRRVIVGSAVAAAVAAVAFGLLPQMNDDSRYVDVGDLLETTSWSAPSDSLLPEHQFDIYRDIPTLIESTEDYGGTLL
jgi:hypothetical protein